MVRVEQEILKERASSFELERLVLPTRRRMEVAVEGLPDRSPFRTILDEAHAPAHIEAFDGRALFSIEPSEMSQNTD